MRKGGGPRDERNNDQISSSIVAGHLDQRKRTKLQKQIARLYD